MNSEIVVDNLIKGDNLNKIGALNNFHVIDAIDTFVSLCEPSKISIITDSPNEIAYVRQKALDLGEEHNLVMKGHTVHFDGCYDQARDKKHTVILLPNDYKVSKSINIMDRETGLREVFELLRGSMRKKECFIRFFSLGPTDSRFSLCAIQITDSAYVAHSEDLLYRSGYEQFKKLNGSANFFTFVHSAGELNDRNCSKNVDKRRIYVDLVDGKVYSVNTQYAGNSLGLKKLALRLAIYKANQEGWLAEHMLVMGVHPPNKDRVTYFAGAFPSGCGKTSTTMVPGQSIVGDDIAYIKMDQNGNARAVNIESGMFGIIRDVNPKDDPLIYQALTTPRELIFSNILVNNNIPYWKGMGKKKIPKTGINFSGEWWEGKKDEEGTVIPFAHSNARYTMCLSELENIDSKANDPEGVVIQGILYGGRDTDTYVPICEALNWEHGVYIGATIESETTSATIGKEGIRKANPMANLDFLVIPLGKYVENHIKFGKKLRNCPKVFAVNYFLKHEGKYVNEILDKKVWLLWSEGRINSEYDAIKTPIGYLPKYDDLKKLFQLVFNKNYSLTDYELQFSLRLDKYLEKIERIEKMYRSESETPQEFWKTLDKQKNEVRNLRRETGKAVLKPSYLAS
jgi:phosphoenolpyruvate carboxykinase (GTP)